MDFKEIRENEKKFNSYVEDAFTRVGKNMLKEYVLELCHFRR